MATTEEILGQFLGDEEFPIEWRSEFEKELFWVYDDLHCPQPLSPMYEDIGGWWLTCDHMFRRFGTPFACDWVAKNINGYLYTAAIPAQPDAKLDAMEYDARYSTKTPLRPDYADRIGHYLGWVLPTYGLKFEQWWRGRLVPEMERNFEYLESRLDEADDLDLPELATVLEDAIDIHDRHWKIHWMLNFSQLSATLNLRAVMEKVRGSVDEVLLGRLQNSAKDRNWDSIEALWNMKGVAVADPELAKAFLGETGSDILAALESGERGRRFLAERVEPYQREFGWHAVWSHEFIFPSVREQTEPVLELVRGYIETDYDYPATVKAVADDIKAAAREILEGLEGDSLQEMSAANDVNLLMAPLTPDHHFYIDQGANAHVRLVLIAIGRKLVDSGALDRADDVIFLRYNELRVYMADQSVIDGRAIVAQRRVEREAAYKVRPRDWVGTVTPTQLAFPYLNLWGFPDKFHRQASTVKDQITGIAGSPGVFEGVARVVLHESEFDRVQKGDILVCQMTNPAWVVLFTKISALVTDAGGTVSHPAVLAREFGIPAVIGSSVATQQIRSGDRLRVDGTSGVVQILSRQEASLPLSVGS